MSRRHWWVLLLAAVAASQAVTAPAAATTVVELALPDLVEAADTIVVARAIRAETVWVGGSLYTRYTLEVDDTLLGDGGDVTVAVPGGIDMSRRHPIAMVVPDAPVLLRDQPVGLFLTAAGFPVPGDFAIVGGKQGLIVLGASGAADVAGRSQAADSAGRSQAADAAGRSQGVDAAVRSQAADAAVRFEAARTRFRDSVGRLIATRGQPRAHAAGVPAPASPVPSSPGLAPTERGPRSGPSAPLFGPGGAR